MNPEIFLSIMNSAATFAVLFAIAILLLYIASKKSVSPGKSR